MRVCCCCKKKTADAIGGRRVGSERCIRERIMAALWSEAAIVQNKETACEDRLKVVNTKAYINASGMDAFFSAT